ncbi:MULTISPECIES: M48 family metallopeptidase [unclassified Streptomyces]|uniref:M48 family metallopeptidase n=1 Tax=unclassified Streptomyces TaxID=2593676 RepID=UPI00093C9288|nr:M48 family metalloprotease [Streptomyces sp. TSRI0281]OKI47781.1 hypothetical protein A6A29_01475 [Streptomyces sp. TSRI0281]
MTRTASVPARGLPGPFALPSGTSVRFGLLIAAMAAMSALLVNGASSVLLSAVRWEEVQDYQTCQALATEEAARERGSDPGVRIPAEAQFSDCEDPRAGASLLVTAAISAGLLLALLAVHAVLPGWRTRRRGYRPLTGMPELSVYLAGLLEESGVRARVSFLTEPLNPAVHALAFGRVGQRRVLLSGGLLTLYTRDRAAFRSIVFHELAHIRNRDLDIAFLTLILWRASMPTLLVLTAIGAPASLYLGSAALAAPVLAFGVQLPLLAVLVTLLKNAVLRSRELYADARVTEWEGSADGLSRLFGGRPEDPSRPGRTGATATGPVPGPGPGPGLRELLSVHPSAARRLTALADHRSLCRIGFWDMWAVGAAAAFLHGTVRLGPIGGGSRTGWVTELVATVLSGGLLVGAAGTVVWQVVAYTPGALTPARTRQAGLGLGLGFGVFLLVSPAWAFNLVSVGGQGMSLAIPYLALTAGCGWALLRWLVLVAGAWGPVLARGRRPRRVLWAVLGLCAAGLLPVFGFLVTLPTMTLYAAVFIAPTLPGAVVFIGGTGYLALAEGLSVVMPVVLTAAVAPLVGQYVSWRRGARHTFTGFGPPGPPPGFLVRFGIPVAPAAAVLGVLPLLIGIPGSELSVLGVLVAGQSAAALWAGRGYAPLPLARGAVAAYSAGLLGMLVWVVLVEVVSGCLVPGGTPCTPVPDLGQFRLALMTATVGTVVAWIPHAVVVRLRR